MIELELITSNGAAQNFEASEVILPTQSGQIGILQDHEHLISLTSEGVIAIRKNPSDSDDMLEFFAVSRDGVIEVAQNKVRILADEATKGEDIDEKEAAKAYELAQKMVADAKDKQSLDQAMASLDRHAVRLKVAELKRHHRHM
jgi:F-type H+-transporting ATPase subunit epsilon